ncbi:hypothetical protein JZ751_027676 [Albula glossodonta]|uniref:Uncharacterized protein n=1 Tax=Albula glossodonta TaxID=121402 RepID=A0A8T2P6T7_9TELE|nr:hypothetical protein JZ751_027676 [Albula glossodonta]
MCLVFENKVWTMVQLSKTGMRENPTLKAGHPPAGEMNPALSMRMPLCSISTVKAGGMRVAKKSSEDSVTMEKEAKRPAEKPRMQSVSVLFAGTLEKLGHDFPETPVSVRHSRLRPAVEKSHSPRTFFIQQPRKC